MKIVDHTYCVDATLNVDNRVLALVFRPTKEQDRLSTAEKGMLDGATRCQVGEVLESSDDEHGNLEVKIEDVNGEAEARALIRKIVHHADDRLMRQKPSLAWNPDVSSVTLTD